MQVFELYFNPKLKEDKIFDSFLFEPENILERRLGSLYLMGELLNVLPQNLKFLDILSSHIKKEYYRISERSGELAFRESLRKANEFLSDEAERGNVSWLGNLSLAGLSLNNSIFHFTKVGSFKIFLLRAGEIFDIWKDLEFQEIEPYPLKIFGNTVSGKLSPEDKIIILSKDIFDFFSAQNIIAEIAKFEKIDGKRLKRLLKSKEDLLGEKSGICLIIDLKAESEEQKLEVKERIMYEKIIPFSLLRILPQIPMRYKLPNLLSKIFSGSNKKLSKILSSLSLGLK